MTAADICRERGWGKDQLLVVRLGKDDWEDMLVCVTAIGKRTILALPLGNRTKARPEWRVFSDIPGAHFDEYAFDSLENVTALDRLPWEVPDATA